MDNTNYSTDSLQKLMHQWNSLGNTGNADKQAVRRAARRTTEQQKLSRIYLQMAIVGLMMPNIAVMLQREIGMAPWLQSVYSLFGLIMAVVCFVMRCRIKSINYLSVPVAEAIEQISRLDRLQRLQQHISMTIGLAIAALLLFEFWENDDSYIFYAGVAGLVVGLTIGLTIRWRIRRTFRAWEDSLSN